MYDPYAEFEKSIFDNGLEVYSNHWNRPWIKLIAVVHAGGREDPVARPGLAHFVEHLVGLNIPGWTHDQAKSFFDVAGGEVKFGSTYYSSTIYSFFVPVERFSEALDIFGLMLLGAKIVQQVDSERQVIFREFNNFYNFQEQLKWDLIIRESVFRGHRLETWNRSLGRPEGFLQTTIADLQGFYDQYYVPANLSLIVVGGLSTEQILAEIGQSPFGLRKIGQRNQIPEPFSKLFPPTEQLLEVKYSDYVKLQVDSVEYKATWAFPLGFSDQVLRVFNRVLNEILFKEVREKRSLAYSINATCYYFLDVYEYQVSGKIDPKAISIIDSLVRFCLEAISHQRELFDRKLDYYRKSCSLLDLSGSRLVENLADSLSCYHRPITLSEIAENFAKVNFDQMVKVAELLSADRQFTRLIMP